MKFGWFFRKNKKQEETKMATTLEEVRKAYEDLSDEDKKSFHQSIADRVHESIAAQERSDGNEDSQSAEAREHEALGEEHADGKGDVEELHESDDTPEEQHEDKQKEESEEKGDERYEALLARIEALEKKSADRDSDDRESTEANDKEVDALKKIENLYN